MMHIQRFECMRTLRLPKYLSSLHVACQLPSSYPDTRPDTQPLSDTYLVCEIPYLGCCWSLKIGSTHWNKGQTRETYTMVLTLAFKASHYDSLSHLHVRQDCSRRSYAYRRKMHLLAYSPVTIEGHSRHNHHDASMVQAPHRLIAISQIVLHTYDLPATAWCC